MKPLFAVSVDPIARPPLIRVSSSSLVLARIAAQKAPRLTDFQTNAIGITFQFWLEYGQNGLLLVLKEHQAAALLPAIGRAGRLCISSKTESLIVSPPAEWLAIVALTSDVLDLAQALGIAL